MPSFSDSNNLAILDWTKTNSSYGSNVMKTELDLRKVYKPWSQTGCFNPVETIIEEASVSDYYSISSNYVDYDSLYIARLLWVDSAGNKYHIKDGDCYFTLQPSEHVLVFIQYIHVTYSKYSIIIMFA